MNRDEVLKALPGDDEFRAAPNYRKKEFAEGFIRAALLPAPHASASRTH